MGIAIILLGVAMVVFQKPFAKGFCALGKSIWSKSKHPLKDEMLGFYEEESAVKFFIVGGLCNIVLTGPACIAAALLSL